MISIAHEIELLRDVHAAGELASRAKRKCPAKQNTSFFSGYFPPFLADGFVASLITSTAISATANAMLKRTR
jgi:hypothetical protein